MNERTVLRLGQTLMRLFFQVLSVWLLVISLNAAEAGKPAFEIRLVLDRPTTDSEQLTLQHQTKEGQMIPEVLHVRKGAVLDQSDVKAATLLRSPINNRPQIGITWAEKGRKVFAEVTRTNLNKRLAILLDGKLVSAPVIRTEIANGEAVIDGDFTEKEASEAADKIARAVRESPAGKMKPWPHGPYDQRRDILSK